MTQETFSVRSHHGSKSTVEKAAEAIFTACGFFAVLAVASITLYMIFSGTPALFKVGILDILFGTLWQPAAATPSFGILYVILTSIVGTFLAILIGVPVGVMTAVFLAEVAPKKLANVVRPAVELLAGIPSVIYGLLGILILNPLMYKMELACVVWSSVIMKIMFGRLGSSFFWLAQEARLNVANGRSRLGRLFFIIGLICYNPLVNK